MRFRTKIYLSILIVSVLSLLGGVFYLFDKASEALKFELRTKVVSVAATAAALIDPKDVVELSNNLSTNNPAFIRLQKELIEARDNNRRPDFFVKYIYILKPESATSSNMMFLVEAQNAVLPGQLDEQQSQSQIFYHLNEFYSPNRLIKDRWGIWMSGFSPIVDEDGNYVATLGVDISAQSVRSTLDQIINFAMLATLFAAASALLVAYFLAHKMTDALDYISEKLDQVAEGNLDVCVTVTSDDEFGKLSQTINHMIKGLKERQALKSSFSRYVSQYVMDEILSEKPNLNLQGERKKITVLFSDIRHFTQISENMSPENVVSLLNEYFEVMLKIIFKHHGTIDKFMGDGIMVEFGAPLPDNEQEIHAVKCGLEMLEALKKLNEKFEREDRPKLNIGIGIHTGYAIMGNIGSETRMEYTAIGDCVNVASRLEQATKSYNHPMLVSEDIFNALNNKFSGKLIGSISLPGRSKEITVYAISI